MTGTWWRLRRLGRPLAACALVAGAVTGTAAWNDGQRQARADNDARAVDIVAIASEADLSRAADGSARLEVVERVTVRPKPSSGETDLQRLVPSRIGDAATPVLVQGVEHGDGERATFRLEQTDDGIVVSIPVDDLAGEQTFRIRYVRDDAVVAEPGGDGQRVAWQVPGALSRESTPSVTGRLRIDPALAGDLVRAEVCSTERSNETQPCTITFSSPEGETDVTATTRDLEGHDTMTVEADFGTDTFTEPDTDPDVSAGRTAMLVAGGGSVAIAGAAALVAATRRRRASIVVSPEGRVDLDAGSPTPVPPHDLSPALAGSLVGRPGRGIVAQLLDAAAKGNVRLRAGDDDVLVSLVTWPEALSRVDDAALSVLVPRLVQPPQSLRGRAGLATDATLATVRDAAERARLVDRPDTHRGDRRLALGAATASVAVPWLAHSHEVGFVAGAGTLAVVLGSIGVGRGLLHAWQTYTEGGRQAVRGLDRLRRHLTSPRDERIAALREAHGRDATAADEAAVYERLLPWAVVLGVEDEWLDRMTEVHGHTPGWLVDGRLPDLVRAVRESDIAQRLDRRMGVAPGGGLRALTAGAAGYAAGAPTPSGLGTDAGMVGGDGAAGGL